MNNAPLYLPEELIEKRIKYFQKKFGIIEDGDIVSDDDYDFTVDISLFGKEVTHE